MPMVRDLRFAWEEMPSKCWTSKLRRCGTACTPPSWTGPSRRAKAAIIQTMFLCSACILLATGSKCRIYSGMARLRIYWLSGRSLRYLLVHNVDTLGADVDPAYLGLHIDERPLSDL